MLTGEEVGGIAGGTAGLPARRGWRSGVAGRGMASAHRHRETVWLESMLGVVLRGSDPLVEALYQRVRTDRAEGSVLTQVDRPGKSWSELAELAVAEGTLTRAEAQGFLRSVGYG